MIKKVCRRAIVGLIFSALLTTSLSVLSQVRIMHVGDSDVSGYQGYASYRYDLWFMLIGALYDVEFVGRTPKPIITVNEALYPEYEQFTDHFHEGQFGRLLRQISANASIYVEANDPHIVMLLASQDVCDFGISAPNLAQIHVGNMIDEMRSVNPNLHFLLGQIYPYENSGCDSNTLAVIPDYNQVIGQVASSKNTPDSRVVAVNHFNGFNSATMFDASVGHANRQGEIFIAGNWFDALENIIPLVEPDGESFVINAGLNDAWFNPATQGQGFFVTVFPDIEMMFMAWFTYDTERPAGGVQANLGEPGHRWLTAFGPYEGNTAELDIEVTSGGVFAAASPIPDQETDGTMIIEFEGCNAGTVMYDIFSAGVSGEIPIQRIANDNAPACEVMAQ